MSKLFSNGCSFLQLRPKDNVNTFVTKILAEQYNLQLFNLAMGGRGNERISFTTKLWFEQNGATDTFAVIGWSSMMRNDYVTNDGWKKGRIPNMDLTWRTWKLTDNTNFLKKQVGWDLDNTLIMKFLDNVLDLQNYFKLKNIPYVMYNALPNYSNSDIKDFKVISNAIDTKRFFKPETSHFEFIKENKLQCQESFSAHPSVEGHTKWANELKEFINTKKQTLREYYNSVRALANPDDLDYFGDLQTDPHPSAEGHLRWAKELKEFIDANNLRTI